MGKFGDKFLNILKLNDDYEDEYDEYEDEDDEEDDEPVTQKQQKKISRFDAAKMQAQEEEQEPAAPIKSRFGGRQQAKVVRQKRTGYGSVDVGI